MVTRSENIPRVAPRKNVNRSQPCINGVPRRPSEDRNEDDSLNEEY